METDRGLTFNEKKHEYRFEGRKLYNVTSFVEDFFPKFKKELIANAVAKRDGLSYDEVIKLWEYKRDSAAKFGTAVHNLAEDCINRLCDGEELTLDVDCSDERFAKFSGVLYKFFNDNPDFKWEKPEFRLFSERIGLAGTVDASYYDSGGKRYLLDWKTNKKIYKKGFYNKMCEAPLKGVNDCNFDKYTLQLSIYRYILEEIFDEQYDGQVIVHLSEKGYEILPVEYKKELVELMIFHGKQRGLI